LQRHRDVRVVAHDAAADDGIRVGLGRDTQSEAPLDRLLHGLTDLLRQRRLGRVVVERKDRDRSDVGSVPP